MLLLNKLDTPCSILEMFFFPRPPPPLPRPMAPALHKRRNKNGLRPVPTTPQPHFLPPWTIFQNKGVLKLLIIIPWRSVELRRLGGGGGGRPDGGELRHAGVSGVDADCDATAAAAAGKTARWKRDGKWKQGKEKLAGNQTETWGKRRGALEMEVNRSLWPYIWKFLKVYLCSVGSCIIVCEMKQPQNTDVDSKRLKQKSETF